MGRHKKTTQGVDRWTTLSGITYYISLLWCKKIYALAARFLQNLISKEVWINFSSWTYFYLHYWFFINLQVITQWAFDFLNTVVIMFCLKYSLVKYSPSFFQYPSFENPDFGDISLHRHRKIIFCVCEFTIVTADVITYYTVYCFQALMLNLVEYFKFTNCYGKANKERIFWHSETWLDTDCLLVSQ